MTCPKWHKTQFKVELFKRMADLKKPIERKSHTLLERRAISWALGSRHAGIPDDQSLLVAKEMLGNWVTIIRRSVPVGAIIAICVFLTFGHENKKSLFFGGIASVLLSYAGTFYLTAIWRRAKINMSNFAKFFFLFCFCRVSIGLSWTIILIQAALVSKGVSDDILFGVGVALISMPMFGGSIIFSMLFWLPVTIGFGISFFITSHFAGYTTFVAYLLYSFLVLISLINISKKAVELSLTSVKLRSVSDYLSVAIAELEEQTSDWLWKTDNLLIIVDASLGFQRAVGNTIDLNDLPLLELFEWHAGDVDKPGVESDRNESIKRKIARHESFSKELIVIEVVNDVKWWRVSGRPQYDENMEFTGYIGVATDVTADCKLQKKTEYLANHDALTGLFNRHRLASILTEIHEYSNIENTAVIVIDLDYFKQVNDKYGHHAGDQLLTLVGRRLELHIRTGDYAARLGGDEFCVVLRKVENDEAETISRRILEALKQPYQVDNLQLVIGASAGIAFASNEHRNADELLRLADVAALQAKHERRGELAVFGIDMLEEHRRASTLRSDMLSAIEYNQFELVFQPIYDLNHDCVIRKESLIRWIHPKYGVVGPGEFIEFAEATGAITKIDEWVLRQVLKIFADGCKDRIAVNISSYSLFAPGFLERIHNKILQEKAFAHLLEIEITETSILRLNEGHEEYLKSLRALGVTLALDDFGTGQSSLARLGAVPCDRIKIDRSLAVASVEKYRRRTILRYVVKLAQEIGVGVCIEGIEDKEMLDFCRGIGADEGQGFYLGRPSEVSSATSVQADIESPLTQSNQFATISPVCYPK